MNQKIRDLIIILTGLFLISTHLSAQTPYFSSAEYKKALWMTTRFYGGQRAGENNWLLYNHLPSGMTDESLRGKSFMNDGDAGYDLSGGWFDCGDHVKFGQTEFYSAYMLLKGYAEFQTGYGDYYGYDYQGYKSSGSWNWEGTGHAPNGIPDILDEVKHASDYFIKCARNSTTFYYQVGQGGPDHALWETAVKMQTELISNGGEMQQLNPPIVKGRVVYKNPNDASMASFCGATLALMSRLYRPYDAAYADLCLVHAKYAYDYAKAHPGTAATGDGGFYTANGNWKDDYASMCTELFFTTGTASYKTEALSFTVNKSSGADIVGNTWGFDYTLNGDIAMYNQYLLGSTTAKAVLDDLVTSYYITKTQSDGQFSGGNTTWGPTRYNANTAFIVALWQKMMGTSATPHKYIYDNIDYLLGKNSSNQSFVVGFGAKSPKHPHHRNVYLVDGNPPDAVKKTMAIPAKNAQFGLLVGGTRNAASFTDDAVDYQNTEGGIDYNACLVGVLAYINSVLAPVSQHPSPNLGADKSLCGVTNIILTAGIATDNKKTFTWKKDNVVVQAASTTGNTYTATAAGTYVVVLDSAGKWSTQDEVVITATLPAFSLGSAVQLCNPATATLDIGVSGTGYTYQWTKNSVVIPGATSKTFDVSAAGTYAGKLSASGCTSTTSSIAVTSSLPLAGNDTLCAAGTAALTITGSGGPYQWYTASTGGTLLTTGNNYSPAVTASTTYYVQDGSSVSVMAGPSSASNTLSGGTNGGNVGLKFTAAKAFTITQVKVLPYVYSCGSSDNVFVTLDLLKDGTKIATYTSSSVPCTGTQSGSPFNTFYTVNFPTAISIPSAGNYTLTPNGGNAIVWFGSGANFSTMDATGVMDITDDTRDDMSNSFPGIFDIKIQSGSGCARTPVYAIVNAAYPNCKATKSSQTITFGALTSKVYGDPDFTLTATASSGLAVSYTSSDLTVATVTPAGVVTITGVGSTTITANQSGNATYNAAAAATQTLVVTKKAQTITFGILPAKVYGDPTFTLAATASSGLAVSYSSSDITVATVSPAGVVTIVGAGTATITASQPGNANYSAATAVPQTLTVGKKAQTITFGTLPAKVYGDPTFTLAATASSGLAVSYSSSDITVATVSPAGVVTIVGAGTATITASQAGNANYSAATAVPQTLTVGKKAQTITFGILPAKVYGDPTFTLAATASSGLAVSYSSSDITVATVSPAGVVTIVGAGTATLTASQAGNANYSAATAVPQTLTVGKKAQTITFGTIASRVVGDPDFTLTATASSGLAVTYVSSDLSVATVSATGTVTIVGAGSTVITASQAGSIDYSPATAVTHTFVVTSPSKTNQIITFNAITSKTAGDPDFALTATASSGLAVTYTSSNTAVATVTAAGVVTIVGAGSAVITANQAGNATYNAAPAVTQTLVVSKKTQTVTFDPITGTKVYGDPTFPLTSSSTSGLPVTYTSSDPSVATISPTGVVTIAGAGTVTITATQAGNGTYAATSVSQTIVIGKASQTITFGAIPAKSVGDAGFTVTATATSGLAVTFTSSNPAVATVTPAGVVTLVGAGTATITAAQAGSTNYAAATSVPQTLTVSSPSKLDQLITFGAITSRTVGDPAFTLTATASSGLAVTYTSSNTAVATVTPAGMVTIVGAGTTTITVAQAGNATYNAAAPVAQTFIINQAAKQDQTISFGTLTDKNVGDAGFTLSATASSGLAVTYTSSNTAVATVSPTGAVTIVGAGTTTITAAQAGNATYNAAAPVGQLLTVKPASAMQIQVSDQTSVVEENGTAVNIGSNQINTSTTPYTFTIKNTGSGNLFINNIVASSGFTTSSIPSTQAILPNATVTFTVYGTPDNASQARTGTITILNSGTTFRLNVSVSVGVPTDLDVRLSDRDIELYPNPTNGDAHLNFNGTFDDIEVTIYSADGSKISVSRLGSANGSLGTVEAQELPSGIYFIEVSTTQGKVIKRLIKE